MVDCMLVQAALAEEGVLLGDGQSRVDWEPWLVIRARVADKCPDNWSPRRGSGQQVTQVSQQLTSPPLWHRGFLKGLWRERQCRASETWLWGRDGPTYSQSHSASFHRGCYFHAACKGPGSKALRPATASEPS